MLGVLQHYVGHMLKPWHTQRHPPQKTPNAYVDSRFNERTTCMHPRTQPQFDHAYTHEPVHNFTTCAHTTTQHTRSYLCKAAPQARRHKHLATQLHNCTPAQRNYCLPLNTWDLWYAIVEGGTTINAWPFTNLGTHALNHVSNPRRYTRGLPVRSTAASSN